MKHRNLELFHKYTLNITVKSATIYVLSAVNVKNEKKHEQAERGKN